MMIVEQVKGLLRELAASFLKHRNLQRASALAYTTLLSLVPLMAVVFAVFTAFPIADQVSEKVQDFVFSNFMPAAGDAVQSYLAAFSAKAGSASGIGLVALMAVAILLMASIEDAFNDIWEVRRKRKLLGRFLIYWAVLSLGPILIAVSVLATSYIAALPLVSEAGSSDVGKGLSGLIPGTASVLAFSLLYWLVPARPVRGWHALLGGLLAGVLFEVAKRSFAWYVTSFTSYEAIYGALAAVPIFLAWIYFSWVIVLLGAEFAHVLGVCAQGAHLREQQASLELNLRLLLALADTQKTGEGMGLEDLAHRFPRAESLLDELREHHLVALTEDNRWMLAKRLDQISLYQLCLEVGCQLPLPDGTGWPKDDQLAALYQDAHAGLAKALDLNLEALA